MRIRNHVAGLSLLALLGVSVGCVGCVRAAPAGGVQSVAASASGAALKATTLPGTPPGAREPQAAVDASGRVYIAFGAENVLYCSASSSGGRTFKPPVKVAEAGALSLGMRRGPRIAVTNKVLVISAVYGRQGGGQDGDLLAWRSTDNGKTWKGPVTVNDVPGAAREGLHAMAAAPDGTLACAWLDLRSKGTKIYAAVSRDGGATWDANRLVYRSPDGTVCECCHPSLAFDAQSRLYVMWRNVLGGNRDLYLTRSDDGGKTFRPAQKLGDGAWPLNACPMDGGSLAVSDDGVVHTFWRRAKTMFAAQPGQPERPIGAGEQGWNAAGPGGMYRVWLQGRPGTLLLLRPDAREPVEIASDADDPMVVSGPVGKAPVVAVWTAGKGGDTSIRAAVLTP